MKTVAKIKNCVAIKFCMLAVIIMLDGFVSNTFRYNKDALLGVW